MRKRYRLQTQARRNGSKRSVSRKRGLRALECWDVPPSSFVGGSSWVEMLVTYGLVDVSARLHVVLEVLRINEIDSVRQIVNAGCASGRMKSQR